VLIVIILLVAALGVISGYSARQMQTMRENADKIQEQAERVESLVRENEGLRLEKQAHETSLEMVLTELDKSA